jgi:hypothetical protein
MHLYTAIYYVFLSIYVRKIQGSVNDIITLKMLCISVEGGNLTFKVHIHEQLSKLTFAIFQLLSK